MKTKTVCKGCGAGLALSYAWNSYLTMFNWCAECDATKAVNFAEVA